ncbi:precorrin-6A/cobalt-precorrin-6A reductase [Litoreibacter ponti]|uniref:Precorrin-6A/cobalt-precorrin-6A reductase n=1 Tax=Litoreibacter ponti TaxID=1510457 RepID=A0A2T6BJ28_9RHOB|nr:cobalt-precorrin-6A reductase [Litoreibacter ponti]PTX56073.1 precorrin-6A/cobalt-precorrin-6A reductase [Litoreibacter ponti]
MKILLLAGTGEARDVARGLVARGHQVIASLAGATRAPKDLGCETRFGGFGGDAGFEAWLDRNPVDLVIDATHPFAHRITDRTARICAARGLGYAQLLRPAWEQRDGDRWTFIDHASEASDHISPGARVFLATGRQTLEQFAGLSQSYLICRQIDPPDGPFPFPNGEFLIGRPPFSVVDEVALFQRLKIDWLVVKNAGGEMSRSKLDAAREIGLRVLMLNRPAMPDAPKVDTVDALLEWVDAYHPG